MSHFPKIRIAPFELEEDISAFYLPGREQSTAVKTVSTTMPPPGLGGFSGTSSTTGTGKRKSGLHKSHSRSYPRGVGLDFRKLAGLTLVSYIDHHGEFTFCALELRLW